jgi:hypothetical protein
MKYALLLVLLSTAAFAQSESIPSTAYPIFQAMGDTYDAKSADQSIAVNNALTEIRENETANNVEFQCQALYLDWGKPISKTPDSNALGNCLGKTLCVHEITVNVNAYCDPRSLQQREIMSLEKTCESQPTQQCFSSDFLDYVGKLQTTNYIDINKP